MEGVKSHLIVMVQALSTLHINLWFFRNASKSSVTQRRLTRRGYLWAKLVFQVKKNAQGSVVTIYIKCFYYIVFEKEGGEGSS